MKTKIEQKVIITNSEYIIQEELSNGWKVKNVTAGHITSYSGSVTSGREYGKFLIVLEK